MNRALLEKPFEPAQIRQRKGRNGVLDYVEGHSVIARLNAALDGAWSFEITHHEIREDEVLVIGRLAAEGVDEDGLRYEPGHAREGRRPDRVARRRSEGRGHRRAEEVRDVPRRGAAPLRRQAACRPQGGHAYGRARGASGAAWHAAHAAGEFNAAAAAVGEWSRWAAGGRCWRSAGAAARPGAERRERRNRQQWSDHRPPARCDLSGSRTRRGSSRRTSTA